MKKYVCLLAGIHLLIAMTALATNKAGIVIQNSTGEVITRCVEFEEDSLPVDTLLERSGFRLITQQFDFGKMLCFLHDDGMEDCSFHPLGWFWNFFIQKDQLWAASDIGISDTLAHNGDVFGFVFGAWNEVLPPPLTFADVCEIQSTAALVIDHSDGQRIIKKVSFPGETITGLQLLQRSGIPLITSETSLGITICNIDGEGQPEETCFGDPLGRYWGFNILTLANEWVSSMAGTADTVVYDGDVHGYLFGTWGIEQPPISRSEIFPIQSGIQAWSEY